MKIVYNLALLLLLVCISACQPSAENETDNQEVAEAMEARYSEMIDSPSVFGDVGTPQGVTPIARDEAPYTLIFAQFVDAKASTGDWLTVSDNILNLKERITRTEPDVAFFYVEQMAAVHIIGKAAFDSMLVDGYSWSDQEIKLLASQVEVLVKNGNPQASLIAPALNQLHGYWPEARIKESAQIAAEATEKWIEQDRSSEMPEGMLEVKEAFAYKVYTNGVNQLKQIADEITE
ncbi:MAG: hypothetical protein KTR29_16270 [Rhodothermaceae bacterium]|nr:hypothetical protein [Rhodothermaceae bacterium]